MKTTIILAAALLAAPLAQAHVSLEQKTAQAGTYQKLTFRVGHGCDGSATNTLTVVLPEAVSGAKPMPKAGWNVSIAEGKRAITWRGGPLPDSQYDEFNMQVKLSEATGPLLFKVIQLCDKGRMEWSEAPGAHGKQPAPVLEVTPAAAPAHQH